MDLVERLFARRECTCITLSGRLLFSVAGVAWQGDGWKDHPFEYGARLSRGKFFCA